MDKSTCAWELNDVQLSRLSWASRWASPSKCRWAGMHIPVLKNRLQNVPLSSQRSIYKKCSCMHRANFWSQCGNIQWYKWVFRKFYLRYIYRSPLESFLNFSLLILLKNILKFESDLWDPWTHGEHVWKPLLYFSVIICQVK